MLLLRKSQNADTKIYNEISGSKRFMKVGLALGLAPKTDLRSMTIGIFTFGQRTTAGTVRAIPPARDNRAFKGTEDATNRFRRISVPPLSLKYLLLTLVTKEIRVHDKAKAAKSQDEEDEIGKCRRQNSKQEDGRKRRETETKKIKKREKEEEKHKEGTTEKDFGGG
ncbi:hypothetical protein ALC57_07165 [Trachymyrmex cornetzi]|uniref:Uncharacterized protein n=1 Tax=Trachymyrmex cornetzi TaxID=471704 RepID=A0A195E599_9HYME|nr:hypothetical protein ALC57_07165 [Trachymyrmex cornetzi]